MILILTRDVTVEECPWLERDFHEGELVFKYTGYTYGCCTYTGIACSLDGDTPFFELPNDAIEVYKR